MPLFIVTPHGVAMLELPLETSSQQQFSCPEHPLHMVPEDPCFECTDTECYLHPEMLGCSECTILDCPVHPSRFQR